jgi:Flp pilus assembly protein TadG
VSVSAPPIRQRIARRVANLARELRSDCAGTVLLEFAFTAPLWIALVLGTLDLGQMAYAKSVLEGVTQDAARDASLEGGDTTEADAMVQSQVRRIAPGATVTMSRVSYFDFSDIGRPERMTDSNGNGVCDNNEPYVDENGNGQWDADVGDSGNGGADDVVMYSVTVRYNRLFRMPIMPGQSTRTITASAVRKNQPFASQAAYSATAGTCAD